MFFLSTIKFLLFTKGIYSIVGKSYITNYRGENLMKNKDTIYNIVVHTINLILLGAIGLFAFFSVVNISPNKNMISGMVGLVTLILLTAIWAINYWFQVKKRKWIFPIVGTVLFVAIALFIFDVGIPLFYDIFIY